MSLVRYLFADTFDTMPNVGNRAACPVDDVLARPNGSVGHAISSGARAERQSAGHSD